MPGPHGRDLAETQRRLVRWFGKRMPEARELRISGLSGPGTTGFSNDTLMFDLCWRSQDQPQRQALVLRLEPSGYPVFPSYDLRLQFRIQRDLAETGIPLARMFFEETHEDVLGAPFYVMQRVEGRIPTDNPPYHVGGWVTEIPPEERAALWWSGLETLARIHCLDWKARELGYVNRRAPGDTPLERELAYYESYLAWAWTERHGVPHPVCSPAFEWLLKNRPSGEPVSLCWGDSRIGNMIFDAGRCVAVLDWEMVSLGSPEMDLAWWIFLDRHHSEGLGKPRLPGFPSREETVARYEELTGHHCRHLDYYEIFAAFRFTVIMIRLAQQMMEYGVLPADSNFEVDNMPSRMLAGFLDLPAPG